MFSYMAIAVDILEPASYQSAESKILCGALGHINRSYCVSALCNSCVFLLVVKLAVVYYALWCGSGQSMCEGRCAHTPVKRKCRSR